MRLWRIVLVLLQLLVFVNTKLSPDKHRERNKVRTKPKQTLKYKDCGSNPDRPIRILHVGARPMPVRAPGKLRLSFRLNVTHALPETVAMDVSLVKYFYGIPFKIPCYNNFGTCHYRDICALLTPWDRAGCPRALERHGIPCSCPLQPGQYSLPRLSVHVPRMEGILAMLAKGDYEATIRLYDTHTKLEYGCLDLEFSMKRRKKRKKAHWMGVT